VARNAALTAKMKRMKAEIVKPQQRIGTFSIILMKVATDVETGRISLSLSIYHFKRVKSCIALRKISFLSPKLFKYKIAKRMDMLTKVRIGFIYT
jgi:hypothetical protein